MSDLPQGWTAHESKSHAGKIYYHNKTTNETTWTKPIVAAANTLSNNPQSVTCSHILR